MTPRTCTVDQCERTLLARGYCSMHYARWRAAGTPGTAEPIHRPSGLTPDEILRWHGWTVTTVGCWLWKGGKTSNGYGRVRLPGEAWSPAHRYAYEAWTGPIPSGAIVRHTCDTPLCINPAHLVLGDHAANMRDMVTRNRSSRGSGRPTAKLTEDQVREIRRLHATGQFLQRELAELFDVSKSRIWYIVTRREWGHVE